MITRSNLAEQLREYQIRSKHEWATLSFFSSTASTPPPRLFTSYKCITRSLLSLTMKEIFMWVDVILVILELLMFAFLVFSGVALYFGYMKLSLALFCVTILMLVCMKITKQVRKNRKSKRRMLLPLSM